MTNNSYIYRDNRYFKMRWVKVRQIIQFRLITNKNTSSQRDYWWFYVWSIKDLSIKWSINRSSQNINFYQNQSVFLRAGGLRIGQWPILTLPHVEILIILDRDYDSWNWSTEFCKSNNISTGNQIWFFYQCIICQGSLGSCDECPSAMILTPLFVWYNLTLKLLALKYTLGLWAHWLCLTSKLSNNNLNT